MLFSGITAARKRDDAENEGLADLVDGQCNTNGIPTAIAPIIVTPAATITQRPLAKLMAEWEMDFGNSPFRPLPYLNFSGNCGLPSSSE